MKRELMKLKIQNTSLKKFRKAMLIIGILSSAFYVIMNIVAAMLYNGYDSASQTVSELSAIGAPTRSLWVSLGIVYTLLVAAFGWGVWLSATDNRFLKITAAFLIVYGLIGLGWPPMHQREVLATGGGTFTDTMHIAFSMVTVLLMLLAMWFSSRSLDRQFRSYSIISIITLTSLGTWTGMEAPKLQQNLPTPWLGVIERILILLFLAWIVVLAAILLRKEKDQSGKTGRKSKRVSAIESEMT